MYFEVGFYMFIWCFGFVCHEHLKFVWQFGNLNTWITKVKWSWSVWWIILMNWTLIVYLIKMWTCLFCIFFFLSCVWYLETSYVHWVLIAIILHFPLMIGEMINVFWSEFLFVYLVFCVCLLWTFEVCLTIW